MKRLLPILAALGLIAAVPAAVHADFNLGAEDPHTGYNQVIDVNAYPIRVASDGEDFFDPFGYGTTHTPSATTDTTDGIQFNPTNFPIVLLTGGIGSWTNRNVDGGLLAANTWVLPSALENEPPSETIGRWQLVGVALTPAVFHIYDTVGTTDVVSDTITIQNLGPDTIVTFLSDPVPEPGRIAALLGMCGMVPIGLVWRMRKRA
jgi:hypothetical protein